MPQKKPLYRKVNTTARGVHHSFGGDFRHERNSKEFERLEAGRQSMRGRVNRGLDYTPLFRFLLSKVGSHWNEVHAEAVARLDRTEPIFWLVALNERDRKDCVRIGEASYFSGLFVDDAGLLQLTDPTMGPSSLTPHCRCCTHTFNGVRFTQLFPGFPSAEGSTGEGVS